MGSQLIGKARRTGKKTRKRARDEGEDGSEEDGEDEKEGEKEKDGEGEDEDGGDEDKGGVTIARRRDETRRQRQHTVILANLKAVCASHATTRVPFVLGAQPPQRLV